MLKIPLDKSVTSLDSLIIQGFTIKILLKTSQHTHTHTHGEAVCGVYVGIKTNLVLEARIIVTARAKDYEEYVCRRASETLVMFYFLIWLHLENSLSLYTDDLSCTFWYKCYIYIN